MCPLAQRFHGRDAPFTVCVKRSENQNFSSSCTERVALTAMRIRNTKKRRKSHEASIELSRTTKQLCELEDHADLHGKLRVYPSELKWDQTHPTQPLVPPRSPSVKNGMLNTLEGLERIAYQKTKVSVQDSIEVSPTPVLSTRFNVTRRANLPHIHSLRYWYIMSSCS